MTPGTLNLIVPQGATFERVLTWSLDDTPVDLTNYTALMQVRPTAASGVVLLELSTDNGGITLGGALGTITLHVDATTTGDLPPGTAVYDLELSTGETVTRLVEGKFTVTAEVSRAS